MLEEHEPTFKQRAALQPAVAAFYGVQEKNHCMCWCIAPKIKNLALHAEADRISHKPGWCISSQALEFRVLRKWGEIITVSICTTATWGTATRPLLLESIISCFTCLHPSSNTDWEAYFRGALNRQDKQRITSEETLVISWTRAASVSPNLHHLLTLEISYII